LRENNPIFAAFKRGRRFLCVGFVLCCEFVIVRFNQSIRQVRGKGTKFVVCDDADLCLGGVKDGRGVAGPRGIRVRIRVRS